VIKRTFKEERYTAKHLLENLSEVSLSNETLELVEDRIHMSCYAGKALDAAMGRCNNIGNLRHVTSGGLAEDARVQG